MITIRDVAKKAGVSVSTVSKVVNKYPYISEETINRVNDAIKELGFVPNAMASSLSSRQKGRVALLINMESQKQAVDEILMQYMAGAIMKAGELGLDVIPFFFSMLEGKSEEAIESMLHAQNVEGVIIYGMSKEDYTLQRIVARGQFKCVLVDVPIINDTTSYIGIDHKQAQMDVVRKTISEHKGPSKEILYISGRENGYVSEARLAGILELSSELGFELSVHCGNFSEKQARDLTIKYGQNYDVIACASDMMAIGAMKALTDLDIFHPVCGFDGITLMGYVGKRMNTVRQNFYEISEEAVNEVSRLLGGEKGRRVVIPHELVRLEYVDVIK